MTVVSSCISGAKFQSSSWPLLKVVWILTLFKRWVSATNNKTLTNIGSDEIFASYRICDSYFKDVQKIRNKLLKNAVSTLFEKLKAMHV